MSEKILVTGATGKVGQQVVRGLVSQGLEVKAGTRNPEAAKELFADGVEVVELDYNRAETYDAAVQWADRLLLTPPPFAPDAYDLLGSFVDWAVQSGTRHLVLLSAMGAERVDHLALRKLERQLEEVGVDHTLLRPNLYMQNFAPGFLEEEIRRDSTVSLPAGDAEVSFVDSDDVADVAIAALLGDEHFGAAYTLTGPETLTLADATELLSQEVGREIRYRAIGDDEFRAFLTERGWSRGRVDTALGLFASIRDGWRAPVSGDVKAVLGREAGGFQDYARRNRVRWS